MGRVANSPMEAHERDSRLAAANKQSSSSKSHGNKKNQSYQVPSTMKFFHISFSACLEHKKLLQVKLYLAIFLVWKSLKLKIQLYNLSLKHKNSIGSLKIGSLDHTLLLL